MNHRNSATKSYINFKANRFRENFKNYKTHQSNCSEAIENDRIEEEKARNRIARLHAVMRPFLLRRLKRDVNLFHSRFDTACLAASISFAPVQDLHSECVGSYPKREALFYATDV